MSRLRRAVCWIAGLSLGACTPVRPPAPPGPVDLPAPEVSVLPPTLSPGVEPLEIAEPPPGAPRDPILHSRWAFDAGMRERANRWLEIYARPGGGGFGVYLQRMAAYQNLVDSALAARDLPRSLRYLPIVESGYLPGAVSRASAVGLWQFMAPVARSFGMQVTPLVDERRDPVRSTLAAVEYLEQLHDRFGSWFLALAAYNGGPSRVERLLLEVAPLAPPSDSLFFVLEPRLPRETRDFVPKLLAAAAMGEDPARYGLEPPETLHPTYQFEEAEVPDATSLDVVARAAGVEESTIDRLNPHLLRRVTPRGRATVVRLPVGTGETFAAAYALIPPDERVTVTDHVVSSGETLSEIALYYGIRVAELEAANPDVEPRRMQIGQRLLVPLVPGSGRVAAAPSAVPRPRDGIHVVSRGESLWTIARRYGVTLSELRSLNGLGSEPVLQPGDRLRLPTGG